MKEMENFRTYISPHFNEKYRLIIVNKLTENNSNTVVKRVAISDLPEVNKFMKEMKMLTNAGWICYYE